MKSIINFLKIIIRSNSVLLKVSRHIRAIIPYEYRKLDREFWHFFNFLKVAEKRSAIEMKDYQFKKLKSLLVSVYAGSEFYKTKYDEANFHPEAFNSLEDIVKIPCLTKEEVRLNWKTIIKKEHDIRHLQKAVTSGTTGKSLTIVQDKKTESREWASICYQWTRVGYMPGDGRIEFRGIVAEDKDYEYIPDERVLRINIIKLSEKNLSAVLQKMKDSSFRFIHGYPSAVMKFSELLVKQKINLDYIEGIMMASEAVIDWQLNVIDSAFGCPIIAHYGQAEKVALGAWKDSRIYEFLSPYSVVEVDPKTNEIIGTSLINDVMPLIRYRTGDLAFDIKENTIDSGLFPRIGEISGRQEDITYRDNGETIPPAIVTFPFKNLVHISNAKIIQKEVGKVELYLEIRKVEFEDEIQKEISGIVSDMKMIYGLSTQIEVIRISKIEPEKSGKYRWIKCEVKK